MPDFSTRRRAAAHPDSSLGGSVGNAGSSLVSGVGHSASSSPAAASAATAAVLPPTLGPSSYADGAASTSASDGLPLYRRHPSGVGDGIRRRRTDRPRVRRRGNGTVGARTIARAISTSFVLIASVGLAVLLRASMTAKMDTATTTVDAGKSGTADELLPMDRNDSPSSVDQKMPGSETADRIGKRAGANALDGPADVRERPAGDDGNARNSERRKDFVEKRESEAAEKSGESRVRPEFKTRLEGAPPCAPLDPDDITYTLVTQLSFDRIWMMKQHCQRWGSEHPISVVVYTDEGAEKLTDELVRMGCERGQLAVQTLSKSAYGHREYPVNVMRNMALSAVRTTHVMYVDVDFWESTNLLSALNLPSVKIELAKDHKLAAVVPAFMVKRQCIEYRDCREENLNKMPNTTKEMIDLVMAHEAGAFDPTNRGGHGSTSYGAWYKQKEGELFDVPCFKSNRYEPYLAFRYCEDLSPFQEQFTGYGKNKMTWVMQLRRQGYKFTQLGRVFLVHYPHLDSKARLEWNKGPKEIFEMVPEGKEQRRRTPGEVKDVDWSEYVRGRMDQLYLDFRDWLEESIPDTSRVHLCEDAKDDDKMLWVNKGGS